MDLNHVTLETADFAGALEFYRTLGLKLIVLSDGRYARFELPTGSSTLSIHHTKQPVTGNTVVYFEVEDVHRRYQELVDQGIKFDSPPKREQWRWEEARFSDPSGNKLCLLHAGQERRFPPWRLTDS